MERKKLKICQKNEIKEDNIIKRMEIKDKAKEMKKSTDEINKKN